MQSTTGDPNCYSYHPMHYPNTNPYQNPVPMPTQLPTHVYHSWQNYSGLGGDPMLALANAMNRLAAAIEKQNERKGD